MTSNQHGWGALSPWVLRWAHLLSPNADVLDVASGAGRHSLYLSAQGHRVTALDKDAAALATLQGRDEQDPSARESISVVCADIENGDWPLPDRQFDAIVMTHYLWRPIWPQLTRSLRPQGVLISETFARGQETIGRPSRPAFLLSPGESLDLAAGLRVVAYEDGFEPPSAAHPDGRFIQRIVAMHPDAGPPALGRMSI